MRSIDEISITNPEKPLLLTVNEKSITDAPFTPTLSSPAKISQN